MLEEIKFDYKVTKIDLDNGEQFKQDFKKISPLSKIPVIIDHKNKKTVFESGAILIYLAELSGKFYNSDERLEINHIANDRSIFAKGAIRSAIWTLNQKPGFFTLDHVLK